MADGEKTPEQKGRCHVFPTYINGQTLWCLCVITLGMDTCVGGHRVSTDVFLVMYIMPTHLVDKQGLVQMFCPKCFEDNKLSGFVKKSLTPVSLNTKWSKYFFAIILATRAETKGSKTCILQSSGIFHQYTYIYS